MQEAEKEMDKAEFEQEVEELTKEQEMPIAELLAKYGIVKGEAADDDDESSSEEEEDGYREDGEEGESGKSKSGAERSGMAHARDKTSWREGASGTLRRRKLCSLYRLAECRSSEKLGRRRLQPPHYWETAQKQGVVQI